MIARKLLYLAMIVAGGSLAVAATVRGDVITPVSWSLSVASLVFSCQEKLAKCEDEG